MENNFTVVTNELQIVSQPEDTKPSEENNTPPTDDSQPSETTSSEDNKSEDDANEETQKTSRYQKRIDKLVSQREEALREKQKLEEELKLYKNKNDSTSKTTSDEINPLDFDTYEEYEEAVKKATEPKQTEEKEEAPITDESFTSAMRKLDDNFDDAREKYKDFDNAIKNPNIPITRDMVIALSELEDAGDVAYYLATNENEAKRIAGLSAYKQAIELGKLETKLKLKPTKKTSQAPDPIDPVKPTGDATKTDPSKMSYREFEMMRNKEENKKSKYW